MSAEPSLEAALAIFENASLPLKIQLADSFPLLRRRLGFSLEALQTAVSLGAVRLVAAWLPQLDPDNAPDLLRVAIRSNQVAVARLLIERFGLTWSNLVVESEEPEEWSFLPESYWDLLEEAIRMNRDKMTRLLISELGFDESKSGGSGLDLFLVAVEEDNVGLAQLIAEQFDLAADDLLENYSEGLSQIFRSRHVRAIAWACDFFKLTPDDFLLEGAEALRSACRSGSLEVVRYLTDRFGLADLVEDPTVIFIAALSSGNLPLVKWVTERYDVTYDKVITGGDEVLRSANNQQVATWLRCMQEAHFAPGAKC